MEASRIICVGNRLLARDDVGPRVFDRLSGGPRPSGVELIDGGLAGLDLLRSVEGAQQVVFVDSVEGAAEGEIVVLDRGEAASASPAGYGHSSGLGYLLGVMPHVVEGPLPRTLVVGALGGSDDRIIGEVARTCLALASGARGAEG